jgi:predicted DNA-binding protein
VLLSFLGLKNRERSKMLEGENMRQTSVYFTHSMKAEIKQLAKKRGWSQGLMIREIVKDYLDSQKTA